MQIGIIFVCVLAACIPIYKKTNLIIGATYFWALFSASRIFLTEVYAGNPDDWIAAIDSSATNAVLILITATLFVMQFPLKYWRVLFKIVAIANAIFLILPPHWGLLSNASMSGCLEVALVPLCLSNPVMTLFAIVSVVFSSRHQPLLALAFLGIFNLWRSRYKKFVFVIPFIAVLLMYLLNPNAAFLNSNGRFEVWEKSMHFWNQHANPFLGFGLGSFAVIGPAMTEHKYIWLHSDYLQILFEMGVIGLILVLGSSFYVLNISKGWLFDAFSMVLLCAGANMPLRYPLFALYALFIIRSIFEDKAPTFSKVEHTPFSSFPDLLQKLDR